MSGDFISWLGYSGSGKYQTHANSAVDCAETCLNCGGRWVKYIVSRRLAVSALHAGSPASCWRSWGWTTRQSPWRFPTTAVRSLGTPPPPPPPGCGPWKGVVAEGNCRTAVAAGAATAVRQLPSAIANCRRQLHGAMRHHPAIEQLRSHSKIAPRLAIPEFARDLSSTVAVQRAVSVQEFCRKHVLFFKFSLRNACCQQKRIIVSLQKTLQDFTVRASRQINHRSK